MVEPNPYYLPQDQARDIFVRRIVRHEFAHVTSHRDDGQQPLAVILVGQPGAGKTNTADYIKAGLAARGEIAHVVGDFYKPYHPDYDQLLVNDPEHASPLTSPDARRWIAMATDYLIEQRADVFLESAGRDQADFGDRVRRFHDNGYRVEVAFLAVDEAQSRLGIVSRYHDQLRDSGQGRLTARATHDASYAGVLDAADVADTCGAVAAVDVYRRGRAVVYANRVTNGVWEHPPTTRQAIAAERARPWTEAVTEDVAKTVTRLSTEMGPAWHPELAEIAALANPLAAREITLTDVDLLTSRPDRVGAAKITSTAGPVAVAFPTSTRESLNAPEHRLATPQATRSANLPQQRPDKSTEGQR